jgi:hypothetical protein
MILLPLIAVTQEPGFRSIHHVSQEYYREMGLISVSDYDSVNSFRHLKDAVVKGENLNKRVFGYHPYWGGSNYLNYQWHLLSDFCHFSYEVNPATGHPVTTHNWAASPAIDSALANGVKVHLCVTLFSGHATFFNNPEARQTLIENIIILLQSRNAHGVNMDIEALPSAYSQAFTDFMIDLSLQMNTVLPDAEVSIAAPAVNWSNKFNIPVLNQYIDFFMVMAYDYYWGGSGQAGPVSPLHSMTGYYDYSFSRTISYYQSEGVPNEKLVMGVPYYAYQWPTAGQYAPSSTTGSGTAFTYRYIRDHAGSYYSPQNKHLEANSFSPYFSFQTNGWNQCFMDDIYSMAKKFDLVNRRHLGGIGIWALGYDNGYTEFWDLIAEKFSTEAVPVNADTIYDSGGPAFSYYNNENYIYTITTMENTNIFLSFSYIDLEEGYDTLWIFDGANTLSSLIGVYTGDTIPLLITASGNSLTLKFRSDAAITGSGWRAVYDTLPVSQVAAFNHKIKVLIYPNPAMGKFTIDLPYSVEDNRLYIHIFDAAGKKVYADIIRVSDMSLVIKIQGWPTGNYLVRISDEKGFLVSGKIQVIE